MAIGILLLPLTAQWIRPSYWPLQPLLLHKAVGWFYGQAGTHILAAAFVVAFASAVWLAIHRQWRSVGQCLLEVLVCAGALSFVRSYS
jgi:hypothetical protein